MMKNFIFDLPNNKEKILRFIREYENVILKFSFQYCPPCFVLYKMFKDNETKIKELLVSKNIKIGCIEIQNVQDVSLEGDSRQVMDYFNLTSFPTTLFFVNSKEYNNSRKIGIFEFIDLKKHIENFFNYV